MDKEGRDYFARKRAGGLNFRCALQKYCRYGAGSDIIVLDYFEYRRREELILRIDSSLRVAAFREFQSGLSVRSNALFITYGSSRRD